MNIIILFAAFAVMGYFAAKAARYGALNSSETLVFALITAAFSGYLIYEIVTLF